MRSSALPVLFTRFSRHLRFFWADAPLSFSILPAGTGLNWRVSKLISIKTRARVKPTAIFTKRPKEKWRVLISANFTHTHPATGTNATNPDNNNLQYLQLPEHLFDKLPMIAHLLTAGKPFSEGAMTGSGRPLSRSEFHQLRDVMFDRGLARWRDERYPTQGVELTGMGKSVMRKAAERTTHARIRTPRTPAALPSYSEGRWEE